MLLSAFASASADRECHFGGALLLKALFAYAHYGLFPSVPYKSKILTALKVKSPPNSVRKAFFRFARHGR